MNSSIIELENLTKYYPVGGIFRKFGLVRAVDGVGFKIQEGETFSLAGESGSGKSTVARLILNLIPRTSGTITFEGKEISSLTKSEMMEFHKQAQIIFQDPLASLNPRKTIEHILSDPFKIHRIEPKSGVESEVLELLKVVGLSPAESFATRHPHELSGGQQQRVAIARAIALKPKFIVADEPVSSLDVSIRGQILSLLKNLQEEFKLTYLFISHDLGVLRSVSDTVAIMYLGKIVEIADTGNMFKNPLHPYTKGLLLSTPVPNPKRARERPQIEVTGEIPSPVAPPPGCRFHPRCPIAEAICSTEEPPLEETEEGHFTACHVVSRNYRRSLTSMS